MHYTLLHVDYSAGMHMQSHTHCNLMGNLRYFKVNDNSVFALNLDFII